MFVVKQHIFYDTYAMYLIYDEIEQKKMEEICLGIKTKKTKHIKNNLINPNNSAPSKSQIFRIFFF